MKVGIGILGGGTVGGALLQYLINEQKAIVAKTGLELVVKRVAVGRPGRETGAGSGRETIWVLGDNAAASHDSRRFGPVPRESFRGRVVWRYWPLERAGSVR